MAAVVPPLLILVVCLSLLLTTATPAAYSEGSARTAKGGSLIAAARRAIVRGDGIDAEMKLRTAMEQGAQPEDVSAFMGEAYLVQGDSARAREWLAPGRFAPGTAAEGWRALAQLEKQDGDLPASGRAYDKALAIIPRDPSLWVEIGRLRYAGGQHLLAIDAAERALTLDPGNVRAIEFRGQLVRDRDGLLAAIPWFQRAIAADPRDVSAQLEYAATLGELGQATECLAATRRVLELSPDNPRAFYLQAVLAARAGNHTLARGLLTRTRGKLDDQPGVQMLRGVLEIAAGNPGAASEALESVLRSRPDDLHARELLLRAIVMAGHYRYATLRFADDVRNDAASPYMLTTIARAWEVMGDRQRAGELLDRAARPVRPELRVLRDAGAIGQLLAQGQGGTARAVSETNRRSAPGSYEAQALAGDVELVSGNPLAAQARYAQAARIRMPENLFERRLAAYALAHDAAAAGALVRNYLAQHPNSRVALRVAARFAAGQGDMARARTILVWLRDNGCRHDVELLSDLAVAEAAMGDLSAAQLDALAAYRIQRANPLAARALGYAYRAAGEHTAEATALLAKAQNILGDGGANFRPRAVPAAPNPETRAK